MQPQGKCDVKRMVLFSAISRQAQVSKLSWVFWLNEIVENVSVPPFSPTCMLPPAAHFTPFEP